MNNTSERRNSVTKSGVVLVLMGLWENSHAIVIVVVCFYFLLIICGIILNTLVCYIMIHSKRFLKSISNLFITHLAAIDLGCSLILTPPLVYLAVPSSDPPGSIPCKFSTFVWSTCSAAIFGSLVVIAVDRYQNIVRPLQTLKRRRRPVLVVLCVWLYAILASFMFLYTAEQVSLDKLPEGKVIHRAGNPTSCDITPGWTGGTSVTIFFVLTFAMPMVTLLITYTTIFVSLKQRCQKHQLHKVAAKSKSKAARMLVTVVSCFVLCWGPSIVVSTLRSYGCFDRVSIVTIIVISMVTNSLRLCCSLVNPLIYAFYSSGFKKDLLQTCGLNKNRKAAKTTTSMSGTIRPAICNGTHITTSL